MPILKAFKGVHSIDEKIEKFIIHSLDNYSKSELNDIRNQEDTSFFHIIEPTLEQSISDSKTKFNKVRENYQNNLAKGEVFKENNTSIYIYEQENSIGEKFLGILGLVSLEDYRHNIIKKHELTLTEREKLFAEYLSEVHIQAEPVLLTYTESSKLDVLMAHETKSKPLLKFTDSKNGKHKVWKVDNRLKLSNFLEGFKNLEALYIADGHHRMSSTSIYGENEKQKNQDHVGTESYNYALSYIIPSQNLKILEFNRLVKDINGHTKESFLELIAQSFSVVAKGSTPYYPSHKNHISMYMEGEFYALYLKHELRGTPEGLGELDTYLFEKYLLKPILNIEDSRTDSRIDFLKGTGSLEGILKLKEKVDKGNFKVAFGFYPLRFQDMKLIADLDLTMPPKSTYIEPKLLSGLMMFDMKK